MKESLKLLARRERREVLGHGNANFWLLVLVITATFLSIAFSNGSMQVLSEKMNDPFTNWVNIHYGKDMPLGLMDQLTDQPVMERFKIKNIQTDHTDHFTYFSADGTQSNILSGRFMDDLKGDLVSAIIADENLAGGPVLALDSIPDATIGVIITDDALKRMGYDPKNPPAFISHLQDSRGADTLGVELFDGKYSGVHQPVLAVAKRLPGNLDLITTSLFFENEREHNSPFDMSRPEFRLELIYYVNADRVDEFKKSIPEIFPDSLKNVVEIFPYNEQMVQSKPARPGEFLIVYPFGYTINNDFTQYNALADIIAERWPEEQAHRVHDYKVLTSLTSSFKDYISVNFERLDSIRAFESFMKGYGIAIDMAQVNAKENFNAVSIMAAILSWAMIIFSIVCIILFIVNMLQSYFQKVKRNMGTFKAFGISTGELIGVYVRMLFKIVLAAIVLALAVSWLIEIILPLVGVLKESKYSYLQLWSGKTIISAVIMVVATLVTVYATMKSLLKHTPGDLIYDR